MAVTIAGAAGPNTGVNSNSDAELLIAPTRVASKAGFVALAAEVDDGAVTGARRVNKADISPNGRLKVGVDSRLFSEQFPGSAINTTLWQSPTTTMVTSVGSGNITLNSTALVTANAVAMIATRQFFAVSGDAGLLVRTVLQHTQQPQNNSTSEWGWFIATGTTQPTDGAFFRFLPNGEFRCVVSNNSVEVQSATRTPVGSSIAAEYAINIFDEGVTFLINGVVQALVMRPTSRGNTMSSSCPVAIRTFNAASAPALANVFLVSSVSVHQAGVNTPLLADQVAALSGGTFAQGQTGGTIGSTANYANSSNPTAAVPSNTAANLGTGLGGQFWEIDTLAVNTDGIITNYQVPAGTAASPGKTLLLTGVIIQSFVQTALTGGGYNAQWSLAFGHTLVSLITGESPTNKAPRRFALGAQSVPAAAAALLMLGEIRVPFLIPVYPGEFVQVVKKKIGTVPGGGVVAHVITFTGEWL